MIKKSRRILCWRLTGQGYEDDHWGKAQGKVLLRGTLAQVRVWLARILFHRCSLHFLKPCKSRRRAGKTNDETVLATCRQMVYVLCSHLYHHRLLCARPLQNVLNLSLQIILWYEEIIFHSKTFCSSACVDLQAWTLRNKWSAKSLMRRECLETLCQRSLKGPLRRLPTYAPARQQDKASVQRSEERWEQRKRKSFFRALMTAVTRHKIKVLNESKVSWTDNRYVKH